jgi:hypothetical protein
VNDPETNAMLLAYKMPFIRVGFGDLARMFAMIPKKAVTEPPFDTYLAVHA